MSVVKVNETTYGLRDDLFNMIVAVGTKYQMLKLKYIIE